MTGTILDNIVETKRGEVDETKRSRPAAELRALASKAPPPRDFLGAIAGGAANLRLIAEIKKASPSAGLIRRDFDPVEIARTYATCGAAALSVLTDRTYFQGDPAFIAQVKAAVPLPVLRKDFIIDEYQICESRADGADAILLIAAICTPSQIESWTRTASDLGMATLIEIHTPAELEAVGDVISTPPRAILGINNRNLRTQTTDLSITERIAAGLRPGTPFVSESGIKSRADVQRMHRAGATALLIGETFMRSADISVKVRELFG